MDSEHTKCGRQSLGPMKENTDRAKQRNRLKRCHCMVLLRKSQDGEPTTPRSLEMFFSGAQYASCVSASSYAFYSRYVSTASCEHFFGVTSIVRIEEEEDEEEDEFIWLHI